MRRASLFVIAVLSALALPAILAAGPGTAHPAETAVPVQAPVAAAPRTTTTQPSHATGPGITAREAVRLLRQGNDRFVAGSPRHPHSDAARRHDAAVHGQHPFAVVISCADSRVPPELLFDRGIGDLFVIRVAGNVCDTDEIASAEYAIEHLGTPLMVVLGHSRCGAVTAAASHAPVHGRLSALLHHIEPAVAEAHRLHPEAMGDTLVADAIRANVLYGMECTLRTSDAIREQIAAGRARLEGAIYDLDSGRIDWLGPHPAQKALLSAPPTTAPHASTEAR